MRFQSSFMPRTTQPSFCALSTNDRGIVPKLGLGQPVGRTMSILAFGVAVKHVRFTAR